LNVTLAGGAAEPVAPPFFIDALAPSGLQNAI
jgi:hypothetical protein